ncbi:3-deoxy-D-manno-octulosonic acid transferase [Guyparkeria halophila]|uniref:3-deoxy-D-manno-octulosonic acid transferase n=1 Tax=Guyparkeria halophila TaxID=47960 RepID=A0A6I6D762_9GAMM|nr:3-deoxy-D-manno-octulosonic acid transferase [Guyparkeria halophila]QGT79311.1 3-deoxy-D-manno-octulosonic acid transferase [Guyparkeria halophila]
MRRWHYPLLLGLLGPWLLWDAWRRHRRARPGHGRLFEQFGRLREGLPRDALWLHAVSLGEVRAAAMLIRAVRARWPDLPIVVSTTTETGAEAARALDLPHFYAPFDYAFAQRRVLARLRPRLMVVMETELWPNLVREAGHAHVPLVIANARLSDRSYRRYARWGGALLRDVLGGVELICAQSPADRERFLALGAGRVEDCGNLKFDLPVAAAIPAVPSGREHTWLAASTHPNEEARVLAAHQAVRQRYPDARLTLVPRHPERAGEVTRLVAGQGLSVETWSPGRPPREACAVELVDRAGLLAGLFAEVPVVFMGGSLVPIGGHNPIEPAAVGRAVLHGPAVENFRQVFAALDERDASRQVADSEALGRAVIECFDRPESWAAVGARARDVIAEHRGAAQRLVDRLARWLD